MKTAIITGITGQDGSYLSELLLRKNYDVHGFIRRETAKVNPDVEYHFVDLNNSEEISRVIRELKPDEIYNLAAQSHVGTSFECPEVTGNITGLGIVRILEAVRYGNARTRVYQASSSEMFGRAPAPQNELTPLIPLSPYATAKVYAHHMCRVYRESYGLHVSCGVLYNHESERRGENFVTRKITKAIGRIKRGEQDVLYLGNLDAIRDWGYAPEYVEVMWKMLQQDMPDDYVIGTGEAHSVRDFVGAAFGYAGLSVSDHVKTTVGEKRPNDVPELRADCTKAREKLGWNPKVKFNELVKIMVDADA